MMSPNNKRAEADEAAAEALLQRLGGIPPQHATQDTVARYAEAVRLLASAVGSRLWFEAQIGLGAHLLESPDGDRAANVEHARDAYQAVIDHATADSSSDEWEAAMSGIANSLFMHPAASAGDYVRAGEVFDALITRLRTRGDAGRLASVLVSCAATHFRNPHGDVDGSLERAILLNEEAIRVLGTSNEPAHTATLGSAQHNLGACFMRRRTDIRSQNVDRAVSALRAALTVRTAEVDPVGRARTLRGLALAYPEWSGPASRAAAEHLAAEASDEAERIERFYEPAKARGTGWARFRRQESALNADFDVLFQLSPEEQRQWLFAVIENHEAALQAIPCDTMPADWAGWKGGLARALGRLRSLGTWEHVKAAYDGFAAAIEVIGERDHPRLWRDLHQRWGELAHDLDDFPTSLRCYTVAAETSQRLFQAFVDPEHRWVELEQTRGSALFAAYAAARVGCPAEAARLAELQRGCVIADALDAARILAALPPQRRDEVIAALAHVQRLEEAMRQRRARTSDGLIADVRAKGADWAGVDPSLLQVRRIDAGAGAPDSASDELEGLRSQLGEARRALRSLLKPDDSAQSASPVGNLSAEEIGRIATAAGFPLAYVMATMHGGMAVVVLPDGEPELLPLEQLTSDLSRGLLFGDGETPGFQRGAMFGEGAALRGSLRRLLPAVTRAAIEPLGALVRHRGHARAALLPLGSLGLLPLHAAGGGDIAWSYEPSARALDLAVQARSRPVPAGHPLGVANPRRVDERSLPFAVVEARALAHLVRDHAEACLVIADAATLPRIREGVKGATLVHFGCHGRFRPSDLLESHLLLAGKDCLTLGEIFSGNVDFSAAQLVTLLACQSGNVEFRRHSDETLGFPAALILGGVPSVVSTMWEVNDIAAALFISRFYELHLRDRLTPACALQRAREWLRSAQVKELQNHVSALRRVLEPEDKEAETALSEFWSRLVLAADQESRPYEAPEYWAAFTLTGA
jgi:hypothetical protein